jgi:NADPH oxidase
LSIRLFIVNDLATISVLFIWLAANIGLFIMRFLEYHSSLTYFYSRVLIFDGVSIARASALCLNFNCLLILLPVCRNLLSLIRYLFPRSLNRFYFRRFIMRLFDQHVEFHRCVGYAICFWTLVHVGAHVYNYERFIHVLNERGTLADVLNNLGLRTPQSRVNPFGTVSSDTLVVGGMLGTIAGITGVVLCICLLVMVSSSTLLIRRSFYEIFWFLHHLFIVFFVGLMLHGLQRIIKSQTNIEAHNPNICAPLYRTWDMDERCPLPRFAGAEPGSWMWLCGPLGIYILERIIRFIRSLQHVELVGAIRHESNVLEIRFRKKSMATPQPGQYIYVKCFSLAKFEWHPFTVTSASEEDYVSVHIRTVGNWTKELAKSLAKYPLDVPRLSIDGPYGSPADDVFNYDGVVLVGAGIGGMKKFQIEFFFFFSSFVFF